MQVQWRLHLHISSVFFLQIVAPTPPSLHTPKPVRKYVEVKIHVPMHVYITQSAYNNERIRL